MVLTYRPGQFSFSGANFGIGLATCGCFCRSSVEKRLAIRFISLHVSKPGSDLLPSARLTLSKRKRLVHHDKVNKSGCRCTSCGIHRSLCELIIQTWCSSSEQQPLVRQLELARPGQFDRWSRFNRGILQGGHVTQGTLTFELIHLQS